MAAAMTHAVGRNAHGTPGTPPPCRSRPGRKRAEAGRRPGRVQQRAATAGRLRECRDQHANPRSGHQDQPPGGARRAQGEAGSDIADAHRQESHRHHPPLGGAHSGERADRLGHRVNGPRLQTRGGRPATDHQYRGRGRGEQAPPGHVTHDHHVRHAPPCSISGKGPCTRDLPPGPLQADMKWPGAAARLDQQRRIHVHHRQPDQADTEAVLVGALSEYLRPEPAHPAAVRAWRFDPVQSGIVDPGCGNLRQRRPHRAGGAPAGACPRRPVTARPRSSWTADSPGRTACRTAGCCGWPAAPGSVTPGPASPRSTSWAAGRAGPRCS